MFISILGRQPGISIAELEVLNGAPAVSRLADVAALVDAETPDISRLGGSIKLASELTELKNASSEDALNEASRMLANHARNFADRKINVGMSVYGATPLTKRDLQKFLIENKKKLRSRGHSVRVIPNKQDALNSAQVFHNKLTLKHNLEIILVKAKNSYWLGRTAAVQNIEELAARDQKRPQTDTKVGMLPPKLALIMLNLSLAKGVVLDPFCGTSVVLQEAMLLGHDVYGTDLEPRMINYSQANLSWLKDEKGISNYVSLEVGDARTHKWELPFDTVVCETYLGPPLPREPSPNHLSAIRKEINDLIATFLKNLAFQTEKGLYLCIGVPAWFVRGKYARLNMLDDLEKLGYTRRVLKHASNEELIYRRKNQIVARELLILERN